jgi:predicted dehydrogenase
VNHRYCFRAPRAAEPRKTWHPEARSYEDLIADPEIEAVYNPLPNHLHVPWSPRLLKRESTSYCKPIGLDANEAAELLGICATEQV